MNSIFQVLIITTSLLACALARVSDIYVVNEPNKTNIILQTLFQPQGYKEPAYPDEPAKYTYTYGVQVEENISIGTCWLLLFVVVVLCLLTLLPG